MTPAFNAQHCLLSETLQVILTDLHQTHLTHARTMRAVGGDGADEMRNAAHLRDELASHGCRVLAEMLDVEARAVGIVGKGA